MTPTITPRENWLRVLRGEKPEWMPVYTDYQVFNPNIIPDNISRAFVFEKEMVPPEKWGGKDMYGINWVYVPSVAGSMEDPEEKPLIADIDDLENWRDLITFPDVDSWDWEGCAARNKDFIDKTRFTQSWIFSSTFERLISFMGFENAAMALIDEEYEDDLRDLLSAVTDVNIKIIGNLKKWFDIDGVYFHDDWGSQKAPFFSLDTCMNVLVPHVKRVVDFCHENGVYFEMHSCGFNEALVPAYLEIGADVWCGQQLNDKFKLRKEIGDKIVIGYTYESAPDDIEGVEKELDKILDEVKDDYITHRMYFQDVPPVPAVIELAHKKLLEGYAKLNSAS